MIIIITLYDYFYLLLLSWLLLFLKQNEKQWALHDECDALGKFNPKLLFIIPFLCETPWMLTFSWRNEQLCKTQAYD